MMTSARAGDRPGLAFTAALMLGQASQGVTFSAFIPALPQMAVSFGGGVAGMQVAQQCVSFAAIGIMAGSFLVGKILGSLGMRLTIIFSLVLFGVFGAAGLFPTSPAVLLTSRVLLGLVCGCLANACVAAISLAFDGNVRARMLGISAGLGSLSSLVGVVAGGAIAQRVGWHGAFILYPLFGFVGAAVAVVGLAGHRLAPDSAREAMLATRKNKVWPVYVITFLTAVLIFVATNQFPFVLAKDGIHNPRTISAIIAGVTVVSAPVSLAFGIIERRVGLNGTLVLALIAETAAFCLIGLRSDMSSSVVSAMLMGVFIGAAGPYLFQLATLKSSPSQRGLVIGLVSASLYLGTFLNPFIFGALSKQFGMQGMFLVAAVATGSLAIVSVVAGGRYARIDPLAVE